MHFINFTAIVEEAWQAYDESRLIKSVSDISAKVSTNHVYKVVLENGSFVIAKLSYFGKYEHFSEDHTIINILANNLPAPFENFLACSLMKGRDLFVHRYTDSLIDAWVVFYKPMKIKTQLPKKLTERHIVDLGKEFAHLHRTCANIVNTLPSSSKTLTIDLEHLLEILDSDFGQYEHRGRQDVIKAQCDLFFKNTTALEAEKLLKIPVMVDWNIGNFSVTKENKLYSRWDYDWFRMSSRILDFYFLSRIVSSVGDRTVFTYNIGPLSEDRFILFLKSYHAIYPLTETEIRLLPEVYRFFILNYVIKDGRYFFHEIYATKLQKEAYDTYFPSIENGFDADKILKALNI